MNCDQDLELCLKDILNTFNITQHIDFPTHIQGHTLDIVATFGDEPTILDIEANGYDVSHHSLVDFKVAIEPEVKAMKEIKYRKLKNIDADQFMAKVVDRISISESGFGENMHAYNTALRELVDMDAPMTTKTVKIVPSAPWFDGEYSELRKRRRRAEKKAKRTGDKADRDVFINLRKETTKLAHQKKCQYYGEKLEGNNKMLHPTINKLLDTEQEEVLPEAESDVALANSFLQYFTEKIEKIRATFPKDDPIVVEMPRPGGKLFEFEPTTEEEIRNIVMTYGVKCSPEDPAPTDILKLNLELYIPIWTKLVNLSLGEGSMECLKNGVLVPLIKQLELIADKENKKNFRPVTNLQFIGKLIERVVKIRLAKHMSDWLLESDFEHGYKDGHSTETLLLKAVNDLLLSCDKQLPSIVMMLDLSAAFDTVDQTKLLNILQEEIGIEGTALRWFTSFITGRTQKVKIRDSYSEQGDLIYGEAQGSVLGPPLFNIYIRSLKKHVDPAKFSIFGFADDHQLIKSFLPVLQIKALDGDINNCFSLITEWMNSYFLRLNASKTQIMIVIPPSLRHAIKVKGTFINGVCIRFVHHAKNLGVILDDELSFKEQVSKLVSSCFIVIRKLSKIRDFLTYEQLRSAVSSLVFMKLDYCNSLYYGINADLINKMQSVQNSAARLVRGKSRFQGSTADFIRECHWLPIKERIVFKICLLVHKCLYSTAPKCLSEMMERVKSTRTMKLVQSTYKTAFGERCFGRVGPKIWNLLPLELRSEADEGDFKKNLKTFLFNGFAAFERKIKEV